MLIEVSILMSRESRGFDPRQEQPFKKVFYSFLKVSLPFLKQQEKGNLGIWSSGMILSLGTILKLSEVQGSIP